MPPRNAEPGAEPGAEPETLPGPGPDAARLRSELTGSNGPYTAIELVARTGSTNADLRAAAHATADRTALIAGQQTAGAGRRGRTWDSPPGGGLYLSVLLRPPGMAVAAAGSITLVAGLAVADAVAALGLPARLKWPNDVLLGEGTGPVGKCAGVLAELVTGGAEAVVVLGIGLNLTAPTGVPPAPGDLAATGLAEHGASTTEPTEVALLLLRALAERERAWRAGAGELTGELAEAYRTRCATLGTPVELTLPGGARRTGRARDIDTSGRLLLDANDGTRHSISAGDVVHLRAGTPA